jgi:CRP-like cAMP-binding protein
MVKQIMLKGADVRTTVPMLLRALPEEDLRSLMATLQRVELRPGAVIQETTNSFEYGYFVESGVISTQASMREGRTVDVGMIGPEGFLGLPLLATFRTPSLRAIVQAPGTALRITGKELQRIMRQSRGFEQAFLRYACFCTAEAGQLAACNAMHEVQGRLARWLLMIQDRIQYEAVPVTHDCMAQALGTNRATISLSAEALKRARLIHYVRGRVRICDRTGLQSVACECYGVLSRLLDSYLTAELLDPNQRDGAEKKASATASYSERASNERKVQNYAQS